MKVCCDFWTVDLILLLMTLFWLFVAVVELLGLVDTFFVVYEIILDPQPLYLRPSREVSFTPLHVGWHLAI
jgi:hypothetical protein